MKIALSVCVTLIILTISCKKSNEQINTVPAVVVDTVKPPVIKPDTSTLVKTNRVYNYDASGTVIVDSSLNQWTYDDRRNIVLQTYSGDGNLDTFKYTYLSDRNLQSSYAYYNGSLVLITNTVYYQNSKNQTDSMVSTVTGYGVQAGYHFLASTYYYYNQFDQDSLEKTFYANNGPASFASSVNYYYTGTNLDSTVGRGNNGQLNNVTYFSEGNQILVNNYTNDLVAGVISFTYTNISSGGLYYFYKTTKLLAGFTSVTIPATTTFTETRNYQFDSANRVTSFLSDNHGSSPNQKQVFTYY